MHPIRSRSCASLKQGKRGCLHDHKKCYGEVGSSDTPVGPRRQWAADDRWGLVAAFGSQPWHFFKQVDLHCEWTDLALECCNLGSVFRDRRGGCFLDVQLATIILA